MYARKRHESYGFFLCRQCFHMNHHYILSHRTNYDTTYEAGVWLVKRDTLGVYQGDE